MIKCDLTIDETSIVEIVIIKTTLSFSKVLSKFKMRKKLLTIISFDEEKQIVSKNGSGLSSISVGLAPDLS